MRPEELRKREPDARGTFQIGAWTRGKSPWHNGDAYFAMPNRMIAGVFDTVGRANNKEGERPGELVIAGKLAADSIRESLTGSIYNQSPPHAANAIRMALLRASDEIFNHPRYGGKALRGEKYLTGIATTAVVAIICPQVYFEKERRITDVVVVGNVGDSRAYIYHGKNQRLEHITLDDRTQPKGYSYDELLALQTATGITDDPGEIHPAFGATSYLTQALGDETIDPGRNVVAPLDLAAGDKVVLVSDGIYKALNPFLISGIISSSPTVQIAAKRLAELAHGCYREVDIDDTAAVVMGEDKIAA